MAHTDSARGEAERLGIFEGFLKTAEWARYADFTDPVNSQWAFLRFTDVGLKNHPLSNEIIIDELWLHNFGIAFPKQQVITVGGLFYAQGYLQQLATIVHENLHLYYRRGHLFIAAKLELELGPFPDEGTASHAIQEWLENDCFQIF